MGLDFRLQTYIFTMHGSRVCAMYILILILVPFKDIEETSLYPFYEENLHKDLNCAILIVSN